MPYEEINDDINHILHAIGHGHVTEYDWLIQNIRQVAEAEYQRKYKNFWRLNGAGLSQPYCHAYFQHLQTGLDNNPPHLILLAKKLYQIPINTKNIKALEFSFCTKLCHMLNHELPIYDSKIILFYDFNEPPRTLPIIDRLRGYAQSYRFLIDEYNRVLNEGLLLPSIQAFRRHFNPKHFTDKKIIDSLIWGFQNIKKRSGMNRRIRDCQ